MHGFPYIADQCFEKAKQKVSFLYPNLYLGELGYFKTIVNYQLVDEMDPEDETEVVNDTEKGDKDISLPFLNQSVCRQP